MSQRERHAGSTIATVPRPATLSSCQGKAAEDPSDPYVPWETLFPSLSPSQQKELLELAEKQGFIFSDQVPAPSSQVLPDRFSSFLNSVRSAPLSIPRFPLNPPIAPIDPELDFLQLDAVSSALRTPDLFLIPGLPGTGKTRVVVEIVRQSVRAGQRVLLLGADHARLDATLGQLGDLETLRVVGRDETLESLSPSSYQKTLAVRERDYKHQILSAAQNNVNRIQNQIDTLNALVPLLDSLPGLIDDLAQVDEKLTQTGQAAENIPDMVRQEAESLTSNSGISPFFEELRSIANSYREGLSRLDAEKADLQKELADQEQVFRDALSQCEQLRPLVELREQGHWWSLTAWKAKRDKTLPDRCAQAESRWKVAEECLEALSTKQAHLDESLFQIEADHAQKRAQCIALEVARRQDEMLERKAKVLGERSALAAKIEQANQAIVAAGLTFPIHFSPEELGQVHKQVQHNLAHLQADLGTAVNWHNLVVSEADRLARLMRGGFALVAGPISASKADSWFIDPPGRDLVFDLVIVEDAQRITESDWLQLSRKGKRWVLVGEPALPAPEISQRFRSGVVRPTLANKSQTDFFHRLWDLLHHEVWVTEDDRLCCRLQSVPTADRSRIDREFVADQPDIELRIFSPENGVPILAEVVFPERMSFADAKEYLYREVGEMAIQPRCRSITQNRDNGKHVVLFEPTTPLKSVELQTGITEWVCEHHTIGLTFDEQFWDEQQVARWLDENLINRSGRRTAQLTTPYRAQTPLAAWLNDAVYRSAGYAVSNETSSTDAIQFEAVPERVDDSSARGNRSRDGRNGSSSDRHHRGGAGLEIDLADPRQRSRLPAEFLSSLPTQGIVNLAEANAISDLLARAANNDSVIVTATTSAQVGLLRRAAPGPARQFLTLEEVAEQECDVLVISLTRSHLSRAVTYGEDPCALIRAMTRVRRRIVLVGDPGTLARRAQWEGAVDHLDEVAGERERTWVKALLRHVPSRVLHPSPARIPEGVKA